MSWRGVPLHLKCGRAPNSWRGLYVGVRASPRSEPEEIEIRALAIHAVERIVAELAQSGIPATARQLDFLLWNRGQGSAYKALPRHRTRSVFY